MLTGITYNMFAKGEKKISSHIFADVDALDYSVFIRRVTVQWTQS